MAPKRVAFQPSRAITRHAASRIVSADPPAVLVARAPGLVGRAATRHRAQERPPRLVAVRGAIGLAPWSPELVTPNESTHWRRSSASSIGEHSRRTRSLRNAGF